MPTYEYKCNNSKEHFEYFQSMKDEPLKKCPVCDQNTLKRLLGTGAGILFKGTGFYQTDYRSESYKKAVEKEKKSTTKSTESKKTKKEASIPKSMKN